MHRIGITASKIAQGNLCKYNLFVAAISFLFSVIIFLACEFCILGVLLILSVVRGLMHLGALNGWIHILKVSSLWVGIIVGILWVLAVIKNIKLGKNKI